MKAAVPRRLQLSTHPLALLAVALFVMAPLSPSRGQQLDFSHGGPIAITASEGMELRQQQREVIARGNARAVRQNVTVTADRLIAFYRPKNGEAAPQPDQSIVNGADTGGNEIYRVQAEGNVRIFTPTDQAQGDRAVYDMDQAVLVMTGRNLKLTTPNDVLTARDSLEYWSLKHMAVARGNAVVVTNDGRRVAADTLVAYTTDAPSTPTQQQQPPKQQQTPEDPLAASGKLQKVEAFGHVSVRTPTDTATGDRAVYVPDSGIARLADNVRITRGQNQLDGQEGEVNMKTGIARLLRGDADRVTGLVVPNDATNHALSNAVPPAGAANPAGTASGTSSATGASTGKSARGSPAAGKPIGGQP
jgi:lipopolysaccharide export system protein LptA